MWLYIGKALSTRWSNTPTTPSWRSSACRICASPFNMRSHGRSVSPPRWNRSTLSSAAPCISRSRMRKPSCACALVSVPCCVEAWLPRRQTAQMRRQSGCFLDRKISFLQIGELVMQAMEHQPDAEIASVEYILNADQAARAFVRQKAKV